MLSVLDLFSGIGGFSLGLERTGGFKTGAFCEIDSFCQKVLAKHWPDVPIFQDIKLLTIKEIDRIGKFDVICGGFPCQPVSVAGKRCGKEDARWMWPEFYRIICEVGPQWVLVENVPGLLSAKDPKGNRGALFGEILGDLASSGYNAEWNIISAASIGAPHLRKRIFIVGWNSNTIRCTGISWQKRKIQNEDTNPNGICYNDASGCESNWWKIEPRVDRMAHGISYRVDRLRGLGNAIVPQVAEYVGNCVLTHDRYLEG